MAEYNERIELPTFTVAAPPKPPKPPRPHNTSADMFWMGVFTGVFSAFVAWAALFAAATIKSLPAEPASSAQVRGAGF
jgi:hypothetical protein